VAAVGEKLVARKGSVLQLIDRWTGSPAGEATNLPGVRLVPQNTADSNIFAIGGDAVVYAFFAR
jgi:hypothetical protein